MSEAIARSQRLKDQSIKDQKLKELMSAANIKSYRALSRQSGVSLWQIEQLRAGKGEKMRLGVLSQLARSLKVPLDSFLQTFELLPSERLHKKAQTTSQQAPTHQLAAIKQEYERLQKQLEEKESTEQSQVKAKALQILESWLVQWPTIAKRAAENENLKAVKVLPFVRPVEQLIEAWGVEAIASVDAEIDYDPQLHQLVSGTAEAGEKVRVTHSGCLCEGNILHRAKVKPV